MASSGEKNFKQCVIAPKQFLQIATNAKGRGVLRLLLYHQQINLLCIPGIFLQILIVAFPSISMPSIVCYFLEILFLIVVTNRMVSDLTVALGRYLDTLAFEMNLD